MTTGRNDFTEVTIEYKGRWDQDRDRRQDWLGLGAEVHTSLWGAQGSEVGGVGDGQELDWSKTTEDLSQDNIDQIGI